jgi:protein SCO1
MNWKLTVVAVGALVLGGLAAATLLGRGGAGPQTVASGALPPTGKPLIGGPFSLIDQTGKRVTDQDFKGRYLLVFFGYTFCPDVCPSGLQVMAGALDKLGAAADAITPVLITIDPARDTPEKLGAYVKSFHPRLLGLTGSADEVAAVLKAYRVYAKKVPGDPNPADYTMDHSSIFYLMGPSGGLVAFSPDSTKVDVLAEQLRKGLAVKGS